MSLRAGGGGNSALKSTFIGEDGSILWKRLTTAIFGGAWLAVATGVTNTILTTLESSAGLYSAFAGFLAAVVRTLLGAPGAGLDEGYSQLATYISGMGPLAFAASVASVLLIAYMVDWVVTNVV